MSTTNKHKFVDLEKAFDRVPRDVARWALRQLGVEEWLVQTVMVMYKKARTTTTVYFNEVVFPSVLGLTSPMAFPQHSPPL